MKDNTRVISPAQSGVMPDAPITDALKAGDISYSTNWMGPIALRWYEERGLLGEPETRYSEFFKKEITTKPVLKEYSAGRIDIYGTESHYPEEMSLPMMASSDWNRFSKWLEGYQTEEVQKLDELLEKYYADGNPEIEWWKDAK